MRSVARVIVPALSVWAWACAPDVVQPGYYGAADAAVRPIESSSVGSSAAAVTADPAAVSSSTSDLGGTPTQTGADAGADPVADSSKSGGGQRASQNPCDMSGQWLVTYHDVADGLGQLQTAHTWLYYEIEQSGEALTVKKGLHCGEEVVARTLLGANVDYHASWPAVLAKVSDAGRKGSSRMTAQGCEISFDKIYMVEGATVPHYLDPSTTMPGPMDQASGATPGWEDWDGDGHPGITMNVSGAATGSLYTAVRSWHVQHGTVESTQGTLQLPDEWGQDENVLGYSGSSLLTQQGVRASDATLHFIQMARVDPSQLGGDDTNVCKTLRSLAKTLTPIAADK